MRQHQPKFYTNEGMRHLQRQIDELWGVVETLYKTVHEDCMGDHQHRKNLAISDLYGDGPMAERKVIGMIATDHDANNDAVTEEVAGELRPDAFQIIHLGRGWYQVVDCRGALTPGSVWPIIHEGKLRKAKAQEVWQKAMEGV